MGYLIIFNAAAAAQFVGLCCLHCTGLLQPSNSYYSVNHDVVGILAPNNIPYELLFPSKTCKNVALPQVQLSLR